MMIYLYLFFWGGGEGDLEVQELPNTSGTALIVPLYFKAGLCKSLHKFRGCIRFIQPIN